MGERGKKEKEDGGGGQWEKGGKEREGGGGGPQAKNKNQ